MPPASYTNPWPLTRAKNTLQHAIASTYYDAPTRKLVCETCNEDIRVCIDLHRPLTEYIFGLHAEVVKEHVKLTGRPYEPFVAIQERQKLDVLIRKLQRELVTFFLTYPTDDERRAMWEFMRLEAQERTARIFRANQYRREIPLGHDDLPRGLGCY